MKGGIYSDQRCPVCGGKFRHFEPNGLWCPEHQQCRPEKFRVKFGKVNRRFKSYKSAHRLLTGLRFKTDEGSFDLRDYQTSNPLGFENLTQKFLYNKRHLKGVEKYEQRLRFAAQAWGNRNVKEIGYPEFEDLICDLIDEKKSPKYIHDINCTVQMLYRWLVKRREIKTDQLPDFYETKPTMAYRKILTKEQQQAVLDEIYKLTWDFNPRIYMAVLFLATYINVRPKELLDIKEEDLELENERILIGKTKEGMPKYLFLLPKDVELLRSLGRNFPKLHVFRHRKGNGGALPESRFGKDYLYKKWNEACKNLRIKGVSLYPGTRHTTAVDLRKRHSPESIKRAMGTKSNKAFERYLQITGDELRTLYQDTRPDTALTPKIMTLDRK